jgi:hypothetical protein
MSSIVHFCNAFSNLENWLLFCNCLFRRRTNDKRIRPQGFPTFAKASAGGEGLKDSKAQGLKASQKWKAKVLTACGLSCDLWSLVFKTEKHKDIAKRQTAQR